MVLITGADGSLGRAVMPVLGERFAVRGLVRALRTHTVASPDYFATGDLTRAPCAALRNALRGARAVIHLAGHAHRDASPAELRAVNVDATVRLAEAAAAEGVAHFVHASSVKACAESSPPGRPLRESDPPTPRDDYGASKLAAERALAAIVERTGLHATILRLPLCYGPGVKANFAALARAVRLGVPLPLARVDNRRSLLGTGNLASALTALVESNGERGSASTYFLADAASVSTPGLVDAMARALHVAPRLWPVPPGVLRTAAACAGRAEAVERLLGTLEVDTSAFRARFAWSPPRSLDEGMAEALARGASL